MGTRSTLLTVASLAILCCPSTDARAQETAETGAQREKVKALETKLGAIAATNPQLLFLQALDAYVEALGDVAQSSFVRNLAEQLRKSQPEEELAMRTKCSSMLLDRVRMERDRGDVGGALPLLLLLDRITPYDIRIRYTLAEVYGVVSPYADTKRAHHYLQDVLLRLTPTNPDNLAPAQVELERLAEILPKWPFRSKDLDEVRRELHASILTLEANRPFRVWLVSSPADDPTREALKVALKRGDQKGACSALEKLLEATERDPSACLLLGLVRSSMGPCFDAAGAKLLISEFLERTPPDRFPQDQPMDADTSRDAIVDRLTNFQDLKGKDDLAALRMTAMELLTELERKPPKPSLFHPDKVVLSKQLSTKERELLRLTADQSKNREKTSNAERELARCRQDFDAWKRKPVRQRGVSDPQPWIDAIERCSNSLDRLQSEAKKLAPQIESTSREVDALRARMSRFGQGQ